MFKYSRNCCTDLDLDLRPFLTVYFSPYFALCSHKSLGRKYSSGEVKSLCLASVPLAYNSWVVAYKNDAEIRPKFKYTVPPTLRLLKLVSNSEKSRSITNNLRQQFQLELRNARKISALSSNLRFYTTPIRKHSIFIIEFTLARKPALLGIKNKLRSPKPFRFVYVFNVILGQYPCRCLRI